MQTREALDERALVPRDDKIYLKNLDGSFGYLQLDDWLVKRFIVHKEGLNEQASYATVNELIKAGWVLD
jgi:hypothetical protein